MSDLLNSLRELRNKVYELIESAKNVESIDDKVLAEAIDLINEIVKKLDDLGDMLLGLTEGEEEEEELYT
ncbi:MAG: hypothetical protein NDP13_06265 [Crenarchaeota archaeon]|nr:hypothetical protein [Thermoproteota archaeon]MCR8501835.1 hypothetical protein [Thermoproteota archaeon]